MTEAAKLVLAPLVAKAGGEGSVRGAVRWMIRRYEHWAWTTLGHAHCQRAVAKWRELNKPVIPAGTLSAAWASWLDLVK